MNKEKSTVLYADINSMSYNGISHIGIKRFLFAGIKKFFDIFISFFGLIICTPLFILFAIAIKLDSKGPIFFKQERTGKYGKVFKLYKFRTMVVENDVHNFKDADKYTRVGKILRKTSLDELPQFINVLKSEMSLIGPRPWITDYYDNMNETQRHRNDVRPGITGLAQCSGRNTLTINDKINYDLKYIEEYSLNQDIKIIFLTVKQIIIGHGVDAGKHTISKELNDLKIKNEKSR